MTIADMVERLNRIPYKGVQFTVEELGVGALIQAHLDGIDGSREYVTVYAGEGRVLAAAYASTLFAEAKLIRAAFFAPPGPDYAQLEERTGAFTVVTIGA